MKKKIAIIGTTSSLIDAPYNDPEWEIWGLNGAYDAVPRYDRWFDLHSEKVLRKHHETVYFDFLKKVGDKLMLAHKMPDLPDAQQFPYQMLVDKYGRYFNNTVAWLIAYAIEQNPTTIGLWGINMAMDTEYSTQRPSCEYFLGIAEGKGIDVIIPESSEIMKCSFLYGVEEVPAMIRKMPDKKRELTNNYNGICNDIEAGQGYMNHIGGYIKGTNDLAEFLKSKKPEIQEDINNFLMDKHSFFRSEATKTEAQLKQLLSDKAYCNGALDLQSYYMKNWGY